MKFLVILLYILSSPLAFSSPSKNQLLKCLGEEEKKFHLKKQSGPLYDLNQKMISEMVQIPFAILNPADYKLICVQPKIAPSLKLLELSLIKGRDLFFISNDMEGMQKQMTVGMIEDYLKSAKEILLHFITQVQAESPTPTCLKEKIPELDAFFIDIKYLEEDLDLQKIFVGRDLKIFEKVQDYQAAFQECRSRIKKKPRSESTTEAKNP